MLRKRRPRGRVRVIIRVEPIREVDRRHVAACITARRGSRRLRASRGEGGGVVLELERGSADLRVVVESTVLE